MTAPIHGWTEPRFDDVRAAFAENFESHGDVGAAVAVYLHGEPVVDLWGGWYTPEREREWDRNTLVNVFSTTKGLTAFCAHRLVEQGRLDIDAPVAGYWPEFAAGGQGGAAGALPAQPRGRSGRGSRADRRSRTGTTGTR